MIKYMRYWLASLLVPALLLCGCGTLKKTKTITEVTTKTDTLLLIKRDTIPIIKTAFLHDTIYLENSLARVTVWYDSVNKKMVAKLAGKPFVVHIEINSHIRIISKEKIVEHKSFFEQYWWSILMTIMLLGWITYLTKRKS